MGNLLERSHQKTSRRHFSSVDVAPWKRLSLFLQDLSKKKLSKCIPAGVLQIFRKLIRYRKVCVWCMMVWLDKILPKIINSVRDSVNKCARLYSYFWQNIPPQTYRVDKIKRVKISTAISQKLCIIIGRYFTQYYCIRLSSFAVNNTIVAIVIFPQH
jgi:hypothetical protein